MASLSTLSVSILSVSKLSAHPLLLHIAEHLTGTQLLTLPKLAALHCASVSCRVAVCCWPYADFYCRFCCYIPLAIQLLQLQCRWTSAALPSFMLVWATTSQPNSLSSATHSEHTNSDLSFDALAPIRVSRPVCQVVQAVAYTRQRWLGKSSLHTATAYTHISCCCRGLSSCSCALCMTASTSSVLENHHQQRLSTPPWTCRGCHAAASAVAQKQDVMPTQLV